MPSQKFLKVPTNLNTNQTRIVYIVRLRLEFNSTNPHARNFWNLTCHLDGGISSMVKSKILLKMSNYVLEEKVLKMFIGHLLLVLDYVLLGYLLKF